MNEKPFGLPMTLTEALERLAKVPKKAIAGKARKRQKPPKQKS